MVRTRLLAPVLLVAALLAGAPAGGAAGGPGGEAFNPGTGRLDVDYAGYLSKHDIVEDTPQTDPRAGLTVGNGRTGAVVWNGNGLTLQVSNVDASEQSAYAAGLVNLNTDPGLDTGGTAFQQRLSLYDGTLTTTYDAGRTLTVLGVPGSEVLGLHVRDPRTGLGTTTLDLSTWDPAADGAGLPDPDAWRRIEPFADADAAGFSRGLRDPDGFGYTLAATVEGAAYTTKVTGERQVRLSITPTANYTVWLTVAARAAAPDRDPVAQARRELAAVRATGYLGALQAGRDFWHAFWARSFVQYDGADGTGDYLENVYYLATYMIAAGGSGTYPAHAAGGVFRAAQATRAAAGGDAYHHDAQRAVYAGLAAAGHTDLVAAENRLYSRNLAALTAGARARFAVDGAWTPEAMGWDGSARDPGEHAEDTLLTGAEVAYAMDRQYHDTGDDEYLRSTAYPFLREVARFCRARLTLNPRTGRYVIAPGAAPGVRDAITDLAAVRRVLPVAVAESERLGVDADLRAGWRDALEHLEPYQVRDGAWLPYDQPADPPRDRRNLAAELIWPLDLTGLGASDYRTALTSWRSRPYPYAGPSAPDAVQAARLGLGDEALAGMRLMLRRYQSYPNGTASDPAAGLAYLGLHVAAVNESLLQSYDGRIRVFPAAPSDPAFTGRFTLQAPDGFLVSSERAGGETAYVGITSRSGGPARVVNPWPGRPVRVRRVADGAVLSSATAAEVTFPTTANTVYVVERTAAPLTSSTHTQLTGVANADVKTLAGTAATLGTAAPGRPVLVNDSALTYDGGWAADAERGYGDYNDDVHATTTVGAAASYTFTGTGVELLAERSGDMGVLDVYVDNVRRATVGLAAPGPRQVRQTVYAGTGLPDGVHTIRIVSTSTATATVDALRITPGTAPPPPGSALRAQVNTRFVTADAGGTSPLIASRTGVGPAEQFDVVGLGGGLVALRARVNGLFVCAENAGANPLVADRAQAGAWETFRLLRNADGTVSLQATVNGRYVTAESAGAAPLIANRAAIGPWEKFDLVPAGRGTG